MHQCKYFDHLRWLAYPVLFQGRLSPRRGGGLPSSYMIGRHDYGPSVSTNLDVSGTVLSSLVGTDASLLEPFKPQHPLSTLHIGLRLL